MGPGDAFLAPLGFSHFFENLEPDNPCVSFVVFTTSKLRTVDLTPALANLPDAVVAQSLGLPLAVVHDFQRGQVCAPRCRQTPLPPAGPSAG